MGILAVDSIKSRTVAPVTVSDDLNVTGVSTVGVLTATSVVVGSAVTVNADGVITSGIVTATTFQGNVNGTTGTFSGDVSIGGTLTYEDVERVDATGLSTFREGLNVGSPTGVGGTFNPQGDISAGIGSFSGAISGSTGTFTGDVDIADKIVHTGDTDTAIRFADADTITAETGGSERVRIASSGRVLIGTDSSRNTRIGGSNFAGNLQLESDSEMGVTVSRFNNTAGSPRFVLQKSRGTGASPTIVQDGDKIAQLLFSGWDGDTFSNAAKINVEVDGTPGDDDMPGRITFETTADGAHQTTERLRITKTGGFTFSNGELIEKCYINSTAWSTTGTVDLDNGMVQYNSSNLAGTTNTLDIISSTGINTAMATGDMMSVTCITAVNAATAYVNNITIDGIAATETWVGGAAPTAGGTSGVDTYAFNIIKTADATFVVIANQVKTS